MNDWKFRVTAPAEFTVPARWVRRVFLHCTASDLPHLKGVALVEEVNRWHIAQKWAGVGYHFLIDKAGVIVTGRPLELVPAAQLGKDGQGNIASIAICTHGMLSFTPESMQATLDLCRAIDAAYRAAGSPVTFHGHKEIDPKPCPVYGYKTLLGLDDKGVLGASTAVPPEVVAAACRSLEVPARPPADGRRLLELGDHGEDVRELQAFLPVLADGDFGATTDAAVRVVQQAHGLAVDGVVGPNTRAALGFA